MNIKELRIGSIVVDKKDNSVIRISTISNEGYILGDNSKKAVYKILIEDLEPLDLDPKVLDQIIEQGVLLKMPRKKYIYYFPDKSTTYFLVFDNKAQNYFIGMIDLNLPEKHRRLTRPFYEYHKLQNSFNVIYDAELKRLNV